MREKLRKEKCDSHFYFPKENVDYSYKLDGEYISLFDDKVNLYSTEMIADILQDDFLMGEISRLYEKKNLSSISGSAFKKNLPISVNMLSLPKTVLYKLLLEEYSSLPEEKKPKAREFLDLIEKNLSCDELLNIDEQYIPEDKFLKQKFFTKDFTKLLLSGLKEIHQSCGSSLDGLKKEAFLGYCKQNFGYNATETKEFLYQFIQWSYEKQLFAKYNIDDISAQVYRRLFVEKLFNFDIQRLINKTTLADIDNYQLNDELVSFVFANMPNDLSDLEKSAYIYVKLCALTSYDAGFYASSQKGITRDFHSKLAHLSEISPQSKELVCYEFTYIFGKLLNMSNINFSVNYINGSQNYGGGHINLDFKADYVVINADPMNGILNNADLNFAKIEGCVKNFKPKFEKDQSKVDLALAKAFKLLKEENSDLFMMQEAFDGWVSEYEQTCTSMPKISFNEKFKILEEQMKIVEDQPKMARLIYMRNLCVKLFEEEIKANTFKFIIIGQTTKADTYDALPIGILAFNRKGEFILNKGQTEYIIYDLDANFKLSSNKEIVTKVRDGELVFIGRTDDQVERNENMKKTFFDFNILDEEGINSVLGKSPDDPTDDEEEKETSTDAKGGDD